MRALICTVGLLAAIPAHAARHELSFEYLGLVHGDPTLEDVFFEGGQNAFGLRGGVAVLRDKRRFGLVVDAGWTRGAHRTDNETYDEDFGDSGHQMWTSRFVADTFTLGLKADVDVANIFYPYLHVQAGLIAASTQLDDDNRTDSNPNQLREGALAPAGLFTAGFELMVPDRKLGWPVTFAIFFEAGYQAAGAIGFDDLGGQIDLSGAVIRSGIGLRM